MGAARCGARVTIALALTGLCACGPLSRRQLHEKAVLVTESRQHGVVVSEIDRLPVERQAGTWLTERLPLDPGRHVIELAYAYPGSGPILANGDAWGGGTTYARPRVRLELDAEPAHVYRIAQEELAGGRWRAWIVEEPTGLTAAGPIQVWPPR
jgi:hypothetical protein